MKWIPPTPIGILAKDDKLADKVAWLNPKVYDGQYDLVELEEWMRGMEKIFTIVEVLEDTKVNIRMFYLADISWNTVKDRLLGSDFI